MILTSGQIAEATGGRLFGSPDAPVKKIATDSREDFSDGGMFTAIPGENVDGHKFIPNVVESGASVVLCSDENAIPDSAEKGECATVFVLVPDVRAGLLDLGRWCRKQLNIPVVSVTGSVGKTTTREMIAAALATVKKTFKTPKNFNSQIGTPITIASIGDEEMAVLEAGMSMPGEMTRIADVIRPDVVVMTNIGVSHIEYLGSRENIFEEKFELARTMGPDGLLIVNGDNDILGSRDYKGRYAVPFEVVKVGIGESCDVRAVDIEHRADGSSFTAVFPDCEIRLDLQVSGDHMIGNALAALAVAKHFGIDLNKAAEGLCAYTGFEGRQKIEEIAGVTFICDYYNASPDSMKAALGVLKTVPASGRRVAVLGNMYELGPDTPVFHREVGEYAAQVRPGEEAIDLLMTVGEFANAGEGIAGGAKSVRPELDIRCFETVDAAADELCGELRSGDIVLLKASNSMKFSKLRNIWEERSTQK